MISTQVNFPSARIYGTAEKLNLYFNRAATDYINSRRVSVFKAKIKGEAYLCFTESNANDGYSLSGVRGGSTVCAGRILEFSGIPIEAFGIRRCVRIKNGVAFKIIQ